MLVFDPRQQYLLFVIECSDNRIGLSHNANSVFIVQSDGEVSPAPYNEPMATHGANSRQFAMTAASPNGAATATACAFQCLWQTTQLLNSRCRLGVGRQLYELRRRQLDLHSV